MYIDGECNECKKEFDLLNDLLKIPDYAKYTPLTQKKICSANLAKSYDAAAILLKQQMGAIPFSCKKLIITTKNYKYNIFKLLVK